MTSVFTLGHSPDPDDAFMFYAMAEKKIDLRGYEFEHILQDIQTLNQRATRGELHISAVSIHALAYILDQYELMPCGASMGDGYGPLLIAPPDQVSTLGIGSPALNAGGFDAVRNWLRGCTVAVPGKMTSAFLALQLFLESTRSDVKFIFVPFDEVFEAVQSKKADVGLLIHEGQLTFQNEGFAAVVDLGVWWKEITDGLPLPLGGNVIRKDIPADVRAELTQILQESIEYGLKHRRPAVAHSMPLARGMDESLADKFIGMYVNDLTIDYGDRGRRAVELFLERGYEAGLIPRTQNVYVSPP